MCVRASCAPFPAPRSRPGRGPSSCVLLPAPERLLRPSSASPPGGGGTEPEGAAGRSAGPEGFTGRCPPASARVTPPWPPPFGAGLAGGRRQRIRPASSGPGGPQISAHFCSRSGRDQILHPDRCLRFAPRAGRSLSSTVDRERSEELVASFGDPEKAGLPRPQRGDDLASATLGVWSSRIRVPRPAVGPRICYPRFIDGEERAESVLASSLWGLLLLVKLRKAFLDFPLPLPKLPTPTPPAHLPGPINWPLEYSLGTLSYLRWLLSLRIQISCLLICLRDLRCPFQGLILVGCFSAALECGHR